MVFCECKVKEVRPASRFAGPEPSRIQLPQTFAERERTWSDNLQKQHATSKNYLYVLRMAVYYANGGRDKEL